MINRNEFPQQVDHEELPRELREFYNSKNQEIREVFEEYQRDVVAGASGENMSEVQYNNQKFQELANRLKDGEEEVPVKWYEPHVERTSPPKVSMVKRNFQLEHRYGKWIRHTHDLR